MSTLNVLDGLQAHLLADTDLTALLPGPNIEHTFPTNNSSFPLIYFGLTGSQDFQHFNNATVPLYEVLTVNLYVMVDTRDFDYNTTMKNIDTELYDYIRENMTFSATGYSRVEIVSQNPAVFTVEIMDNCALFVGESIWQIKATKA